MNRVMSHDLFVLQPGNSVDGLVPAYAHIIEE
jgi:hypothetical protein